jgi:hypothetical protein
MTYWIADLVEEFGISESMDVQKMIEKRKFRRRSIELAAEASEDPLAQYSIGQGTQSIAAVGRHLDLSGTNSCGMLECLIDDVEQGLVQVWQLFDVAVVEGYSPRRFLREVESSAYGLQWHLISQIKLFLHLRDIGALDNIQFLEKPHQFCEHHFEEIARDLEIPVALNDKVAKEALRILRADSTLKVTEAADGGHMVSFKHPYLSTVVMTFVDKGDPIPTKRDFAERVLERSFTSLIGDVVLAKNLDAPLISDAWATYRMIKSDHTVSDITTDDVALSIEIPMLKGLGSEALLRLRRESPDHFTRFRAATLAAVREQINQVGSVDPKVISRRIQRDFIEPALADMRIDVDSSRKTLAKKVASQVVVGGVLTTIGLVTSSPLIIGSGVIGAGISALAPFGPLGTYWDRRQDIEMNDLFFLLKAERKAREHQ